MYIVTRKFDETGLKLYLRYGKIEWRVKEYILNPKDYSITFHIVNEYYNETRVIYDVDLFTRLRGYGYHYIENE